MNSMKVFFFLVCIAVFQIQCSNPDPANRLGFNEWYAVNITPNKSESTSSHSKTYTFYYDSPELLIDTIFRSMEGPYSIQQVLFEEEEEQMVWITGYSVELIDASNNERLSDGFMCHNNLNIKNRDDMPWQVYTLGSETRTFTLTEGQTEVTLPEGFGIPAPADMEFSIMSQVLNHNIIDPNLPVLQKAKVLYLKDSELSTPLKALYQQSAFITKLTAGPLGQHGEKVTHDNHNHDNQEDTTVHAHHQSHQQTCEIEHDHIADYNPYFDEYGRKFTGHWTFTPGREILKTNVTTMLNIKFDTRVHYIGVHVHPFAESLELVDITDSTSIFKSNVENHSDKIGIKKIGYFSSVEGVPMYKDHEYELISIYNNTTKDNHTAMATMFLFLAEQE